MKKVTGPTLWANLFLLFWLSLTPFVTGWMGAHHNAPGPVAVYGGVLTRCQNTNAALATALGRDFKGKISVVIYLVAISLAFVRPWLALVLYAVVAALWFVPDTRIEKPHGAAEDDAG